MMNLPPGVSLAPPQDSGVRPQPKTVHGTHRFPYWAMACPWGLWIPASVDFDYAARLAQEVWDEIDRIEGELSRFLPTSDIARLNERARQRDESWLEIGSEAWECFLLGLAVNELSGGAFDMTLGALLEARRSDDDRIALAEKTDGWGGGGSKYLQLAEEPLRARLLHSDAQLDLGAIGKGFALDLAAQLLRDWSIENALLYAGQSTVLALGDTPPVENDAASKGASTCSAENGWALELRLPEVDEAENPASAGRVEIKDAALSGSAQSLHGYHIIDPHTGQSARQWRASWAVAPSAALSDACSTAFMAMNETEIRVFCEQQPAISALLLDAENRWCRYGSQVWDINN